jgi:branched-subunit amino acid aminotransferase/4-amino-4-deoxychorismate lyase
MAYSLIRKDDLQGADTVFVTNTARTIDLVTAYVKVSFFLASTAPLLFFSLT